MLKMPTKPLPCGHLLNGEWYIEKTVGCDDFEIFYHGVGVQTGEAVIIREYFPVEIVIRAGFVVQPRANRNAEDVLQSCAMYFDEGKFLMSNRHRNFLPVVDSFEEHDTAYIVNHIWEGETLAEHIIKMESLEQDWVEEMLGGVMEGLSFLHEKGRFHLDIRPANIALLGPEYTPFISSIGGTRQFLYNKFRAQRNSPDAGVVKDFLAPEQTSSKDLAANVLMDIYGLAATLFNCISGSPPAQGSIREEAIQSGRTDPQSLVWTATEQQKKFSKGFLRAINVGLEIDPDLRPRTLLEWNQQLFWDEEGAKHRFGRLWVEVQPENAKVVIGNNTPYSEGMRLSIGVHQVRVTAPYYQSRNLRIEIAEGETRQQVKLPRFDSILSIESEPENAGLRLDGMVFRSGDGVVLGDHEFEAGAIGYKPYKMKLRVRDANEQHKIVLQKKPLAVNEFTSDVVLVRAVLRKDNDRVVSLIQAGFDVNISDSDGRTALMAACFGKQDGIVSFLLQLDTNKVDVELRDDNGATALIHASSVGATKVVLALLGVEADLEMQRWDGMNALMLASGGGHTETVKVLLRAQADTDINCDDGRTALMLACAEGYTDVVAELLAAKAELNSVGRNEQTALMLATQCGYTEIVTQLLHVEYQSLELDKKNHEGMTALMLAAEAGQVEIVKALVDSGANINSKEKNGNTAEYFARQNSHGEIASLLLDAVSKIVSGVKSGGVNQVKTLLDAGYNVNAVDKYGRTALLEASDYGDIDSTEVLLANGAIVNLQDSKGRTALLQASINGHVDVVMALLVADADLDIKDEDGKDAMDHALNAGHREIAFALNGEVSFTLTAGRNAVERLQAMLAIGISVDSRGIDGGTALIEAVKNKHLQAINTLLQRGANTDFSDDSGKTAIDYAMQADFEDGIRVLLDSNAKLFMAASSGKIDIVREFLQEGCYVNAKNGANETALMAACRIGALDIIDELLYAGADVNGFNHKGESSLSIAIASGKSKPVHKLLDNGATIATKDGMESVLTLACQHANVDVIERILKDPDIDVDSEDSSQGTALMVACKLRDKEIVDLLVAAKANPDVVDGDKKSALMLACERGNNEIVGTLIVAGSKVNLKDDLGRSALIYTCENGHTTVVQSLLKAKAKVGLRDANGWNGLMYASVGGHTSIVELILRQLRTFSGHKLRLLAKKNKSKQTAMTIAKGAGKDAVVRLLSKAMFSATLPFISGLVIATLMFSFWLWLPSASEKLYAAVEVNDFNTIKLLLEEDGYLKSYRGTIKDIDVRDNEGRTALMKAAKVGHLGMINLLLNSGSELNARDSDGRSAVMLAIQDGKGRAFETLIALGANLNISDNQGKTTMIIASENGYTQFVDILLTKGLDPGIRDNDGGTALIRASQANRIEVVERLLDLGVNVNLQTNDGKTALILAGMNGYVDIVDILLNSGADSSLTDKSAKTVLDYAAMNRHSEVVAMFDVKKFIFQSAIDGDVETVRSYLDSGVAVDIRDNNGSTPLMEASSKGYAGVIALLLEYGADIAAQDKLSRSALDKAKANGHQEAIRLLIEAGLNLINAIKGGQDLASIKVIVDGQKNLNIVDTQGNSALFIAMIANRADVVEILLQSGAKTNTINPDGQTALLFAANAGNSQIVKLLLQSGFKAINFGRGAALFAAVEMNNSINVNMLLQAGANPNIRNADRMTPLLFAASSGFVEVVDLLIANDAQVNTKSKSGDTSLLLAIKNSHIGVVRSLVAAGSKDGYKGFVEAEKLGNKDLIKAMIDSGPARLWVKTQLNNTRVIMTNLRLRFRQGIRLPLGEYKLMLSSENYQTRNLTANLKPGNNRRELQLRITAGQLFIDSDPKNVNIKLNGKNFENGSWLPFDKYKVEVSAHGLYRPVTREIVLNKQRLDEYMVLRKDLGIGDEFIDCATCPEMRIIAPGRFNMGIEGKKSKSNAAPKHEVNILRNFAVSKFEVTFKQWNACVADGGCGGYKPRNIWRNENLPVVNVNWHDTRMYTTWLQQKTGHVYRLPSEAEWEYVARGNVKSDYSTGNKILTRQANYNGRLNFNMLSIDSSNQLWLGKPIDVGSFAPNSYGLYDIHGNAQEWIQDCWNFSYKNAPTDGSAWRSGECVYRVIRGGSWEDPAGNLKTTFRNRRDPVSREATNGFRVVREMPERRR